MTELNNVRPKQPFFFLKPPSAIVLPGAGPCVRPKGVDLHYEIELALIIGKQVRDLKPDDEQGALDAIDSDSPPLPTVHRWLLPHCCCIGIVANTLGYALALDMTARNVQNEAKKKGLPWDIAKGFDTFLPISQIIPKSAIPDPHNIEVYLTVNGEVRQQDSTELLLFRIPRLLSDISRVMPLEPGDLVLTGTPKGVGLVVAGDVMKGGIRVNGKEIEEAKLEVPVVDSEGDYDFAET